MRGTCNQSIIMRTEMSVMDDVHKQLYTYMAHAYTTCHLQARHAFLKWLGSSRASPRDTFALIFGVCKPPFCIIFLS